MEANNRDTIEEQMKSRGDHPVLTLRHELREERLRYAVGESGRNPHVYSIYVEYTKDGRTTTERISSFSKDRDVAEGFCAVLARYTATPLSLHALYEDSLTP